MLLKYIKTKEEFQVIKDEMDQKVVDFMKSYDTFTRLTSPKNWRTSGHHFSELRKLKDEIKEFEPLKLKDLDNEHVRDSIMTDEEKEIYKNSKKFNI